jgi:hypothetical protein
LCQGITCGLPFTFGRAPATLADESLETGRIDRVISSSQPVAARPGFDQLGAERFPQAKNEILQHLEARPRSRLTPHRLGETTRHQNVSKPGDQGRQRSPLRRPRDRHMTIKTCDLQRTQHGKSIVPETHPYSEPVSIRLIRRPPAAVARS